MNDYISAVQIGVTMTSIGIGALGEPALAHLLRRALGGPLSHGVAVVVAVVIAYLLITVAQLIGGEMVPKFYAVYRAEAVAMRIARPLGAVRALLDPIIIAVTAVSNRILRLLGVDPSNAEEGGSPDELKRLIAQSFAGGQLDQGEAGMLSGVFHLHEQEARQVMTPIPAVVTVDTSEDVETALRRCISTGHTRLLVTEDENRDRVRGIVHSNSLARLLMSEGPHGSIVTEIRDVPIVPETKPLDDLLADLQRVRSSMSVVVDEYGRVAGIVTVEDIVEEVVGEITDETDPHASGVRRLPNGDWFVRGHVALADLDGYGLSLPADTDAYNSVGGFVFGELGRLPQRGDTVNANGYSIRVESVRENRIEAVRISERRPDGRAPEEAEPEPGNTGESGEAPDGPESSALGL
jgi:CBS domain containing-hemolysin-like protein